LNAKSRYIKIYENKILEQKINAKKKFFKDEYNSTKEEEEFLKQKANKNNTETS
jgi:putative tetraheme cytochrome c